MKKIIILLIIIFLIIGLCLSNVFAESIKETTFNISSGVDKGTAVYDFGAKILNISYFFYLALCLYLKFYGIKQIHALKYGGIVNEKEIVYSRDKPKSINLPLAFSSLYYCSNIKRNTLKKGIIGAYLLKWSYEDKILITNKENKIYSIDLKDGNFFKPEIEQELYDILKDASGDNNIIDSTEFKDWYRLHRDVLDKWHNKILSKSQSIKLKPIAEYLLGLKKYLLDYSLIEERRHIEVKLWEEYLIYAQIIGISDDVNKQFNDIYPDYSKVSQLCELDIGNTMFRFMIVYLFFLIPLGLAIPTSIIISIIYYILMF